MKTLNFILEGFYKNTKSGYAVVAKEVLITQIKDVLLKEFAPKGKLKLKFSIDPKNEDMLVVYNDYDRGVDDISRLRNVREYIDNWQGNKKYFEGQVGAMEVPVYGQVADQDDPSKLLFKARFGIYLYLK